MREARSIGGGGGAGAGGAGAGAAGARSRAFDMSWDRSEPRCMGRPQIKRPPRGGPTKNLRARSDARDQQILVIDVFVTAGALAERHADALEGGGLVRDLLRVRPLACVAEADKPNGQVRPSGLDPHAVQ